MDPIKFRGVTVVNGTRVKWGTLFAVFVAGPVLAVSRGVVGSVLLVGSGISAAVRGPREFVVSLVTGVSGVVSRTIASAWGGGPVPGTGTVCSPAASPGGFLGAVCPFGPLAFPLGAVAIGGVLVAIIRSVEVARGLF